MPPELIVLALSIVLLFVHIAVQGFFTIRDSGAAYNAGPRDEQRPVGKFGGRAKRALENYKETWPAFLALALALAIVAPGAGVAGAWLWLVARVVYLPLYVLGVPWLRSVAYFFAVAGIALMLLALLGAA